MEMLLKKFNLKYLKIQQSYYSVFIKRKLNKYIKRINSPMPLALLNEQDSPSNKVPIDGPMSKRTWSRHKQGMLFSHIENKICHWLYGSNWKFYSKVKGGRHRGRDHLFNSDVELRNSGLVGLMSSAS